MVNQNSSGKVIDGSKTADILSALQEWEHKRPNVTKNENFSRKKLTEILVGLFNKLGTSET